MKPDYTDAELAEFWQILRHEKRLLEKKKGVSQLAYVLLLNYFKEEFCFFDTPQELPDKLIQYGLELYQKDINVSKEALFTFFDQTRSINRYKQEIREHFHINILLPNDLELLSFLQSICLTISNEEELKNQLIQYLKRRKIEIPKEAILVDLIKTAKNAKEKDLFNKINQNLSLEDRKYIDEYILSSNDFDGVCHFLRQDGGSSKRDSIKAEIARLRILKKLPLEKFDFLYAIDPKIRRFYKRRFLSDTPERTRVRTDTNKYALVIVFCHMRRNEITDNLVEHLVNCILKMKQKSEAKKAKMLGEIAKNLEDIETLFLIAKITHDRPEDIIKEAVYPFVPHASIEQLLKAKEISGRIKAVVRETLIKSYSRTYRCSIFEVINNLEFSSNNKDFLNAVQLIKKYQHRKSEFYPVAEEIKLDNIISKQGQKLILKEDDQENLRVSRKEYECAILKLLRTKLRHKEVWVQGALIYRNPEEDLPKDFDEKREEYYQKLGVPICADTFVEAIQIKMKQQLSQFDMGLPTNKYVQLVVKDDKPWIKLSPLEKQPEPQNLEKLKEAILKKWGVIDLLDILKEVDLREGITECFNTAGNREILDRETIRKRLLLCLFGIGTNAGLTRVSAASKGLTSFEELRHIRKFFLNKDDLREAINKVVDGIFKIRNPKIWGTATTACGSDSTQRNAYDQNLMTQWGAHYRESGIMIYWHVNDQSICIYSQLKTCTSSEVASMLEGIISHNTDMAIEAQYVDSHGKSQLGFALSYFLGFDLLPRFKEIGAQKLYLPQSDFEIKNIQSIITRAIDWNLIKEQYDEMVKHAVALKVGTANADAIIRKFARSNYQHTTFKAMIELGKAIQTIFLCRFLDSIELRQQIHAGLNVVENWNGANDFIYFGQGGDITSNRREDQEVSMLCLHLLQVSITYVNTLLIEDVLREKPWLEKFTPEDLRGLTPLFYLHINPYGTFELDLAKRLHI